MAPTGWGHVTIPLLKLRKVMGARRSLVPFMLRFGLISALGSPKIRVNWVKLELKPLIGPSKTKGDSCQIWA